MRYSLTVLRSAAGHITARQAQFHAHLTISQVHHVGLRHRRHGFSTSSRRWRDAALSSSDPSELTSTDARLLREAFDNPAFFKQPASRLSSTGRFGYPALKHPSDFPALVSKTRDRAQAIVNRLLAYDPTNASVSSLDEAVHPSVQALLHQVKQIDRLSDLLCGVIDVAEVIRFCDPSPDWKAAADAAYAELCYFMNELNTHVQLYQVRSLIIRCTRKTRLNHVLSAVHRLSNKFMIPQLRL